MILVANINVLQPNTYKLLNQDKQALFYDAAQFATVLRKAAESTEQMEKMKPHPLQLF